MSGLIGTVRHRATLAAPNWAGDEIRGKIRRNTTWRNESFRGYADYMETEKFRKGVERLVGLANKAGPAAIMCAEATWWRCHRALISDYLKARGFHVMHILDLAKTEPHPFTSAARLVNGELSYTANDSLF